MFVLFQGTDTMQERFCFCFIERLTGLPREAGYCPRWSLPLTFPENLRLQGFTQDSQRGLFWDAFGARHHGGEKVDSKDQKLNISVPLALPETLEAFGCLKDAANYMGSWTHKPGPNPG